MNSRSSFDIASDVQKLRVTVWREGQPIFQEQLLLLTDGCVSDIIEAHSRGSKYIQIDYIRAPLSIDSNKLGQIVSKDNTGLYDLSIIEPQDRHEIYSSDLMIKNKNTKVILSEILHSSLTDVSRASDELLIAYSPADTIIYDVGARKYVPLFRGARFFDDIRLTIEHAERMSRLLVSWIVNNTSETGRMNYKTHPSDSAFIENQDNPIRQWMTTAAFAEYARRTGARDIVGILNKNFAYNIKRFFRSVGDFGIVEHEGSAKLGASALAALAIVEQEGTAGPHADVFIRLLRGIDTLYEESGQFKTFFYPSHWTGNQNFYPGETLYLWSILIYRHSYKDLIPRFLQSTRFYKEWFRNARNPAFVPWHTFAQYYYYRATGDRRELDFIFEMNDFLLEIQETNPAAPLDIVGRFFDPSRSEYGPPHASSTAVYLESLIYARRVAEDLGLTSRVATYSTAIDAAFLNLSNLQYKEEAELFYVAEPKAAWGGVRTNPYDNVIRVDNVQHALAACNALYKVSEASEFEEQKVRHG